MPIGHQKEAPGWAVQNTLNMGFAFDRGDRQRLRYRRVAGNDGQYIHRSQAQTDSRRFFLGYFNQVSNLWLHQHGEIFISQPDRLHMITRVKVNVLIFLQSRIDEDV
jgi:hypothetical protein